MSCWDSNPAARPAFERLSIDFKSLQEELAYTILEQRANQESQHMLHISVEPAVLEAEINEPETVPVTAPQPVFVPQPLPQSGGYITHQQLDIGKQELRSPWASEAHRDHYPDLTHKNSPATGSNSESQV